MASTDKLVKALAEAEARGDAEAVQYLEGELQKATSTNLFSRVGRVAADLGKSTMAGVGQTTGMGLEAAGQFFGVLPPLLPLTKGNPIDLGGKEVGDYWQQVEEEIDLPKDVKSFTKGVGSAALVPNPTNIFRNLALGGAVQIAGDRGAEMAGPMGGVAAALGTGLAGGRMINAPSRAERVLHDSGKTVAPADWATAKKNLQGFEEAGSTTFTLPDAFPNENAYQGLLSMATSRPGGEAAALRLAGRDADIGRVTKKAIEAIGPAASPQETVRLAAEAAADKLKQLQKRKNRQFELTMKDAPELGQDEVQLLSDAFKQMAKGQSRPEARDAFLAMDQALRDANKTIPGGKKLVKNEKGRWVQQEVPPRPAFITDPQQLSLTVNALKKKMVGPTASPDKSIPEADWNYARAQFDELLRQMSPEYEKAMTQAAKFNQGPRKQARTGPLGTLAGRGEVVQDAPIAPGRLDSIIAGQAPKTTFQTLRALDKPGGDLSKAIMRSLLEKRVRKTGETPSSVLRGAPESLERSAIDTGLDFAGADRGTFERNLELADLLTRMQSQAGASRQLPVAGIQAVAEPYGTTRRLIGEKVSESTLREVSNLLANPSPMNFERLRRLAEQDPRLADQVARMQVLMQSGLQGREEQ